MVLQSPRHKKLYAKFKKYEIWLEQIAFLGHVVSKDDILIEPGKIEVVVNRTRPTSVNEIRSFFFWDSLVFTEDLSEGFSSLAAPLTKLTRKNKKIQVD